jgi:16S rRNA processing protein RimM
MNSSSGSDPGLNPSGSPRSGEPVFLAVGRLGRPFGVQGEILMAVYTDFPDRLEPNITLYVGPEHHPLLVNKTRWHGGKLVISFEGYTTREKVGELRNQWVMVRTAERPPLPEGEFYHHQVLGLRVVDDAGLFLGTLKEILTTGANDVYLVKTEQGGEILLPAIDSVVLEINLDEGVIRVKLLPGLV